MAAKTISATDVGPLPFSLQCALLCDLVRKEITGKDIIIGVYSEDLIVPQLPAQVALALYIRARGNLNGTHKIDFQILGPHGAKLIPVFSPAITSVSERLTAITLEGIVMNLQTPGKIVFQWKQPRADSWESLTDIGVLIGDPLRPGSNISAADPTASQKPT